MAHRQTRSSPTAIPSSSVPVPILASPSVSAASHDHPCQERLFSEDDVPLGRSIPRPGVLVVDLNPRGERDSRATPEFSRQGSRGSIHELQGQQPKESLPSSSMSACSISSPSKKTMSKTPSSEDDDTFEDAHEELLDTAGAAASSSPQRKLSKDSGSPIRDSIVQSETWKKRRKHIFILSEAGKPIFSQFGDEDELASLMAVMQAMVSYVLDMGDTLKSFQVEGNLIVFLVKGPLILVAVSRGDESYTQLNSQLNYIYYQLLSVLTLSSLTKIFEQRKGYDLRKMIAGSERLLNSLSAAMDSDPSFMLSAVKVLPMPPSSRDPISNVISSTCAKLKNVVFAILIADNQLITMARMKKYFLHAADLHLLFNLVNSTESFKLSETWTPICLPKFDSSGFMQGHVSYLSDECPACLIMLTVERDIFFELSEAKKKIVESLEKTNSLSQITTCLTKSRQQTTPSLGFPEIRHFLYKAKTACQFTSPAVGPPYSKERHYLRLHGLYLSLQNKMHSTINPVKLVYHEENSENVLGWLTNTFELYTSFSPTTSKSDAIQSVNRLLKWSKKEEASIFILNAPTF